MIPFHRLHLQQHPFLSYGTSVLSCRSLDINFPEDLQIETNYWHSLNTHALACLESSMPLCTFGHEDYVIPGVVTFVNQRDPSAKNEQVVISGTFGLAFYHEPSQTCRHFRSLGNDSIRIVTPVHYYASHFYLFCCFHHATGSYQVNFFLQCVPHGGHMCLVSCHQWKHAQHSPRNCIYTSFGCQAHITFHGRW